VSDEEASAIGEQDAVAVSVEDIPAVDEGGEGTDGMDRRKFLVYATVGIGGLITVGLGVPVVVFFVSPANKEEATTQWLVLGSPKQVELGTPTLFKTTIERKTGWVTSTEEVSVYVETEDGQNYTALSNVCTHLGCRVRWSEDKERFFCPCHGAVFSKEGEVLAGPPPRPLDRFDVKVEDDTLEVNFRG